MRGSNPQPWDDDEINRFLRRWTLVRVSRSTDWANQAGLLWTVMFLLSMDITAALSEYKAFLLVLEDMEKWSDKY